mgnify:CR=1 FL=1
MKKLLNMKKKEKPIRTPKEKPKKEDGEFRKTHYF